MTVTAEWIDYNGHMTEYRYLQVMADATDVFLARIGADPDYAAAGHSYYTAETHIRHLGEAHRGDRLIVDTGCSATMPSACTCSTSCDGTAMTGWWPPASTCCCTSTRWPDGPRPPARRCSPRWPRSPCRGRPPGPRGGGSAHRGTVERLTPAESAELLQCSANIRLLDERDQRGWRESKRDLILCMERHRLRVAMDGDTPLTVPGPEGRLLVAFTDDDAAQAWAETRHPAEGIEYRFAPSAHDGAQLRA